MFNPNPNPNSFTFVSDPDQHVCEVQLVHEGMLTARKHCNAHTGYVKFRSALELLETFGLMRTPTHTDVDTSATQLVSEELVQRKFVQELGREYDTFLRKYQQMLGILPVVDTDDTLTLEDVSASHDTATGSATELKVEVRRLQHENTSQQKQVTAQQQQITEQQHQITTQQQHITDQRNQITEQRNQINDQQHQITEQRRQIEQVLLKLDEFQQRHSTFNPSH